MQLEWIENFGRLETFDPSKGKLSKRLILKFADLKSSNLYWVHLTNSEFFKADLQGVISGNIEGVPKSLPDEWVIKYGTLINEEWGSSNPPDKVLLNEQNNSPINRQN